MGKELLTWIAANDKFLAIIGGFVVFIFWGRRKASLDIEKLKLEIKNLKQETLIHRPTFEEINQLQEHMRRYRTPAYGLADASREPLEVLGPPLYGFLRHLLAYYGDSEARLEMEKERLMATMEGRRVETSASYERLPDPKPILSLWRSIRQKAVPRLSPETVAEIDSLLHRFSPGQLVPPALARHD